MSMDEPAPEGRRYRGMAPAERRAARRRQMIAAAIRVYGEVGYRRASVRMVCEAAGLTERYFYESFPNSAALLIAAYDRVNGYIAREMGRATAALPAGDTEGRLRAAFGRYFAILRAEPASARVFLLEMSGLDPSVDEAREAALAIFGRLADREFATLGAEADGDDEVRATIIEGVIGGVSRIARRWVECGFAPSIETVTEASCRLCAPLRHDRRARP